MMPSIDPKRIGDFHRFLAKMRKRNEHKCCLNPLKADPCQPPYSAAHTVQRAMLEKFLAEEFHVLQFDLEADLQTGLSFEPKSVGLRKASTFNGFCNHHDTLLFKPLETRGFDFEPEQIALLGFRSIAREYYLKEAQLDSHIDLIKHYEEKPSMHRAEAGEFLLVNKMAIENSLSNIKVAFDLFGSMINGSSFSELRSFTIVFEQAPVYFGSGAFLPEFDFEGGLLQDLGYCGKFVGLSFSVWEAKGQSVVVFCWHKEWDGICVPFIESIRRIDASRLANRILAMAFEVSNNITMKPSWWHGLTDRNKMLIVSRIVSGIRDRDTNCLKDFGITAFPEVQSRFVEKM